MATVMTVKILVVEDNPATRRMYIRLLSTAGYDVAVAASSRSARRIIARESFDLILIDLVLESAESGRELLSWLQENSKTKRIPVVMITGHVQSSADLAQTIKLGAADCLTKSMGTELLLVKIEKALADSRREVRAGNGSGYHTNGAILVVDDDDEYRSVVETGFSQAGYAVHTASRGREAVSLARELRPAAMILDFGLPDMTGVEVVRELKNDPETSGILILVLTGNNKKGREITCLNDGADDYMVKGSSSIDSVIAHVKALLRIQAAPSNARLTVGPVTLDIHEQKVYVDGGKGKKLTPKEFDLLVLLMDKSPDVLDWEALGKRICDSPVHSPFKAKECVRVHLCHLKHKLGPKGAACVMTHKQQGLQFVATPR